MKKFEIIGNRGRKYAGEVTRHYYSKHIDDWLTKHYRYEYGKKTKYTERSSELIVKDGEVTEYGKALKRALAARLGEGFDHQIETILYDTKGDLKESTLLSKVQKLLEDKEYGKPTKKRHSIRQYIYNMGGDLEELAADMGIDPKILGSKKYWTFTNGGKATFSYNGAIYEFNFKYSENRIIWDKIDRR